MPSSAPFLAQEAFRGLPLAPIVAGAVGFAVIWVLGRRAQPASSSADGPVVAVPSDARAGLASRLPRSWRESMSAAGVVAPDAQITFVVVHALCIAAGALAGALAAQRMESPTAGSLVFGAALLVGWWLPASWLEGRRGRRRVEMTADFPMMLDLLRIALGGSLGLPAAWASVAGSMRGSSGALAEEMRRIELEVAFGLDWSVALDQAAVRTGVPAFRSLGSLVAQSTRFGTELSKVLEVLSDSLRLEAMQSLEERAHVASVRLLVPLGALLLPATVIVMVGPLWILLIEVLQQASPD